MRHDLRLLAAMTLLNLGFWLAYTGNLFRQQAGGLDAQALGRLAATPWAVCLVALAVVPRLVAWAGHRTNVAVATLALLLALLQQVLLPQAAGWGALLLGWSIGVRWAVLDGWIAAVAPAAQTGRVLALGETLAGATMTLAPLVVEGVAAHPLALAALGTAVLLPGVALCWRVPQPAVPAGARRWSRAQMPALVLLLAAGAGGFFEGGFVPVATLLAGGAGGVTQAAAAVAMLGAGSLAGQLALGVAADRHGARRTLLACTAALVLALALVAAWPAALVAACFAIGAFGGGLYTLALIASARAADAAAATSAISLGAAAYTTGAIAAPVLSGASLEALGPQRLLAAMGVALLLLMAAVARNAALRASR